MDKQTFEEQHTRLAAATEIMFPGHLQVLLSASGRSAADIARESGLDTAVVDLVLSGSHNVDIATLLGITRTFIVPFDDWDKDKYYEDRGPGRFRGGKQGKRDQWGGPRPDEYKHWFHLDLKPQLKGVDTDKFRKKEHDEWEKYWRSIGCPVPKSFEDFA